MLGVTGTQDADILMVSGAADHLRGRRNGVNVCTTWMQACSLGQSVGGYYAKPGPRYIRETTVKGVTTAL